MTQMGPSEMNLQQFETGNQVTQGDSSGKIHPKEIISCEKVMKKFDGGIADFQCLLQNVSNNVNVAISTQQILPYADYCKAQLDRIERFKILCVNRFLMDNQIDEAQEVEERFHKVINLYYSFRREMQRKKEEAEAPTALHPHHKGTAILSMPSLLLDNKEGTSSSTLHLGEIKEEKGPDNVVQSKEEPIDFIFRTDEDLENAVILAATDFEWTHFGYYKNQITKFMDTHGHDYL